MPDDTSTSTTTTTKPMIEVTDWKPLVKKTLRGFCTVKFPMGLIIREVMVHEKQGRKWVNLPAKPQLNRDGALNYKDGKLQYAAILEWKDKETRDRFSNTVIRIIEEKHPDAI